MEPMSDLVVRPVAGRRPAAPGVRSVPRPMPAHLLAGDCPTWPRPGWSSWDGTSPPERLNHLYIYMMVFFTLHAAMWRDPVAY